ncbi:MAG: hypothetical protein LBT21_00685 [Oscillospiraceae bacterium]|jgi:hypothetical protein|nr:hypothetical protein [Oscillospiraceae bacterium]
MTNQVLTEAIRALEPCSLEWEFLLYNSGKTKDGVSFMFGKCPMANIGAWLETVLDSILEVNLRKQTVTEYSAFLPKEEIGAIAADSPLMSEGLSEALGAVKSALPYNPEDFLTGLFPKVTGLAFHALDKNGRHVLLMKRSNPFMGGKKVLLCDCDDESGTVKETISPLLKFTADADFLLIGGEHTQEHVKNSDGAEASKNESYSGEICYFLSAAAQKDFALEDRAAALCAKATGLIGECDMVSDFIRFEEIAKKQARKFEDFSEELTASIGRMGLQARDEFVSTYGVSVASDGRIDTNTPEQCALLIDFLCSRSCLDIYGRLAVGNKITPRE